MPFDLNEESDICALFSSGDRAIHRHKTYECPEELKSQSYNVQGFLTIFFHHAHYTALLRTSADVPKLKPYNKPYGRT